MSFEELHTHVTVLIGNNRVEEAFEVLDTYLKQQEKEGRSKLRNESIILRKRLFELNDQQLKGHLTYDEISSRRNRICDAFLKLLDKYQDPYVRREEIKEPPATNQEGIQQNLSAYDNASPQTLLDETLRKAQKPILVLSLICILLGLYFIIQIDKKFINLIPGLGMIIIGPGLFFAYLLAVKRFSIQNFEKQKSSLAQ